MNKLMTYYHLARFQGHQDRT